jgi:hypothetical protein
MIQLKKAIPWWAKIGGKITLSHIHFPYKLWRRLSIFQHGLMLDPIYAQRVFLHHYERVRTYLPSNYTLLELGPGDSLATALMGAAHGAKCIWLVDAGAFAEQDVAKYADLQAQLGMPWINQHYADIQALLQDTNASYWTEGLRSLQKIPAAKIDFIFSQAVLEHVLLSEFESTMAELFRIQPPGGVASHRIDLQDHLEHSLHSLRFSEQRWESALYIRSGFYTNRLRASQIVNIVCKVGYEILDQQNDTWDKLPIDRSVLAAPFASMPDEELLIRSMDLVVRKPQ